MAKRGQREQKKIDLGKVINSAVEEGIEAIIEHHPRFKAQEDFLVSHIDKKKLKEHVGEAIEELQEYETETQQIEAIKKLYENTAGYIASGELFTDKGKELVLRKSWERDAKKWFGGGTARDILSGEKYLDDVMGSFRELYSLFKSGDYAERMPELASAVATVYDMGFTDAAVNILYENGLMNKGKYKAFKRAIRERTKQGVKTTEEVLTKYFMPEKVAAGIFGIVGVGILVLSGANITGNVIGSQLNNSLGILSGVLLLIASFLVLRLR